MDKKPCPVLKPGTLRHRDEIKSHRRCSWEQKSPVLSPQELGWLLCQRLNALKGVKETSRPKQDAAAEDRKCHFLSDLLVLNRCTFPSINSDK